MAWFCTSTPVILMDFSDKQWEGKTLKIFFVLFFLLITSQQHRALLELQVGFMLLCFRHLQQGIRDMWRTIGMALTIVCAHVYCWQSWEAERTELVAERLSLDEGCCWHQVGLKEECSGNSMFMGMSCVNPSEPCFVYGTCGIDTQSEGSPRHRITVVAVW